MTGAHFDRWLELFDETVDELFDGAAADRAKARATKMARALPPPARSSRPGFEPDRGPMETVTDDEVVDARLHASRTVMSVTSLDRRHNASSASGSATLSPAGREHHEGVPDRGELGVRQRREDLLDGATAKVHGGAHDLPSGGRQRQQDLPPVEHARHPLDELLLRDQAVGEPGRGRGLDAEAGGKGLDRDRSVVVEDDERGGAAAA